MTRVHREAIWYTVGLSRVGKQEHLEDILMECAQLRGVQRLPHRTVHEFDWFISACIWGDLHGDENEKEIEDRYGKRFNPDADNLLLEWARLFREYCREEYKEE